MEIEARLSVRTAEERANAVRGRADSLLRAAATEREARLRAQQAREARAEQNRYLERAADRAYLAMHAPLAPLLAVLVLLVAYGFLRFLAHTV